MTDINKPIEYDWKLGWNGVTEPYPIVNPLLKAIIEKDIKTVQILESQGASLRACNVTTLSRVIFHVADSYPIMEWLVKHGMSRIANDIDSNGNNKTNDAKCISSSGYLWGISARAYYLKAYDVMDLLCSHGFSDFSCFDEGWDKTWYADEHIFRIGDERAINILLSNGYCFPLYGKWIEYYEYYVLNRIQVKRKSIGLDSCKWRNEVPSPQYEDVPLLFGKRDAIARNDRRREDYEDRVRAHKQFKEMFGRGEHHDYLAKKEKFDKEFDELMKSVLESGEI